MTVSSGPLRGSNLPVDTEISHDPVVAIQLISSQSIRAPLYSEDRNALNLADAAAEEQDWELVSGFAPEILAVDPNNENARSLVAMFGNGAGGVNSSPASQDTRPSGEDSESPAHRK